MAGVWQYTSVTRGDSSLFPVSSQDTMIFNQDGSFRYDIDAPNRHSYGTWSLFQSKDTTLIILHYHSAGPPVRRFRIDELNSSNLVISENGVVFSYLRKSP